MKEINMRMIPQLAHCLVLTGINNNASTISMQPEMILMGPDQSERYGGMMAS